MKNYDVRAYIRELALTIRAQGKRKEKLIKTN